MRRSRNRNQGILGVALAVAGSALILFAFVPGIARVEPTDVASRIIGSEAPRADLPLSNPFEPSPSSSPSSSASRLEPVEYAALGSKVEPLSSGAGDAWRKIEQTGSGAATGSSLPCLIEPHGVVEVGSPVTGLIESISVERADVIDKGQILVVLDSRVELAAVELARSRAGMDEAVLAGEARLKLGEQKHSRVNKLYESDTLSLDLAQEMETEVELAKLELRQARAEKQLAALELQKARAALDRRTIRSPFSGVVVERMLSPGERVEQEPILRIAQIDPLRVEVILPAAMFGSIEKGARATVVPEFPGDTVHIASVEIVDRVVDSASGTFGVQLELPNQDHAIPGGVHCQVRFLEE